MQPEKLDFGGCEDERKYAWEEMRKEGPDKGILSATTSVSIIADAEGAVKVFTLMRLNQYPYKRVST